MHLGIALPFSDFVGRRTARSAKKNTLAGQGQGQGLSAGGPHRQQPGEPASSRAGRACSTTPRGVGPSLPVAGTDCPPGADSGAASGRARCRQAASLSMYAAAAAGWPPALPSTGEFVGLDGFHNRGKRSEEQVEVMKALWADPLRYVRGQVAPPPDAGINRLPHAAKFRCGSASHGRDAAADRKWGDGWMMLSEPPGPKAVARFDKLRRLVEAEGRDPRSAAWESGLRPAPAPKRTGARKSGFWKKAASRMSRSQHLRRLSRQAHGWRSMTDHVDAMRRYRNAVADLV